MEAKEEIYQYIRKNIKEDGVTAQSIAEIFGIKRNVASHYLNLLEKEGKLQKGTNRPVHFSIPTDTEKKAEECNNMIDERPAAQKEVSVFSKFIGYNGSMEQVIEKCKAAVNYPVNGLTMIICGASGVGKSYLASLIHQYAVESGAVEKNAPFVVLNCADYANNSELLSSVLFGHVKGAFTGANEENRDCLQRRMEVIFSWMRYTTCQQKIRKNYFCLSIRKNIECWATAKTGRQQRSGYCLRQQKIFTVHCLQHSEEGFRLKSGFRIFWSGHMVKGSCWYRPSFRMKQRF